ncbi:hypothetical protein SUGI_0267060 [Cryptomeria japonica]|nr:hypothetical protein SUGI_0267060 [Cryptomeria japonica]
MGIPDSGIGRVHPSRAGCEDWGNARSLASIAPTWLRSSRHLNPYAHNGQWEDQSIVVVRHPNGGCSRVNVELDYRATVTVVTPLVNCRLEGDIDVCTEEAQFKDRYLGLLNAYADMNAIRRWVVPVGMHYRIESADDFAWRVLPRILTARSPANLVTMFTKYWLYFFMAIQGERLGAPVAFAAVAGLPATNIENSRVNHAEFDAYVGPLDGTVVDPTPSMERCRFWRAGVVRFPAYQLVDNTEEFITSVSLYQIPGGQLRYCGACMVGDFADWGAFPTPAAWLMFINSASCELNAQDDALLAFQLASSIAFATADRVVYRGRAALPAGATPLNQVHVTASLQIRGIPLPELNLVRLRNLPLLQPGDYRHPMRQFTTLGAYALARVGGLWAAQLCYGLKHARYAFGVTARRIVQGGIQIRDWVVGALFEGARGVVPYNATPILMCASHIMRCCFGSTVPYQLARHLSPGADESATDGGTTLAHVYGAEPQGGPERCTCCTGCMMCPPRVGTMCWGPDQAPV